MKFSIYIYHLLLLFGFSIEYSLPIPGMTTRRLAIAIAIITLLSRKNKVKEVFKCINRSHLRIAIVMFLLCALISMGHYVLNPANTGDNYTKLLEPHFILLLFLYIFVFSLFCVVEFDNIKSFAITWVSFILLESISIFFSATNYAVRLFFYQHFYVGDGRFDTTIEFGSRVVGIGIHSSMGSVIMSSACVLLVMLSIKRQISSILFAISYSTIVIATAFIGRTGLVIEIVMLIYYGILTRQIKSIFIGTALPIIAIVFGLGFLLSNIEGGVADKLAEWMLAITQSDVIEATFEGARGSGISFDNVVFGNGILRGTINGKRYFTDSGLVMIFNAIGFVGFICYYGGLYFILKTPKGVIRGIVKWFYGGAVLLAFVIEYKEPYFLNYVFAWVLLTMMMFDAKESYKMKSSLLINSNKAINNPLRTL